MEWLRGVHFCSDCKFYDDESVIEHSFKKGYGLCRKSAPVVIALEDDSVTCWPIVSGGNDWCGEGGEYDEGEDE